MLSSLWATVHSSGQKLEWYTCNIKTISTAHYFRATALICAPDLLCLVLVLSFLHHHLQKFIEGQGAEWGHSKKHVTSNRSFHACHGCISRTDNWHSASGAYLYVVFSIFLYCSLLSKANAAILQWREYSGWHIGVISLKANQSPCTSNSWTHILKCPSPFTEKNFHAPVQFSWHYCILTNADGDHLHL